MKVFILTIVITLFSTDPLYAYPLCSSSSSVGSVCAISVSAIHPTQAAVGMIEVQDKIKKISEMSSSELEEYFNDRLVPLVMGPNGLACATDRHHLSRAALEFGIPYVYAVVKDNWAHLKTEQFWNEMVSHRNLYLFDETGKKLSAPQLLPTNLKDLKNDPYRSLAWAAREKGCYAKTNVLYAEFKWAEFFRTRVKIGTTKKEFKQAITTAMKLCHSNAAEHLPGYSP